MTTNESFSVCKYHLSPSHQFFFFAETKWIAQISISTLCCLHICYHFYKRMISSLVYGNYFDWYLYTWQILFSIISPTFFTSQLSCRLMFINIHNKICVKIRLSFKHSSAKVYRVCVVSVKLYTCCILLIMRDDIAFVWLIFFLV